MASNKERHDIGDVPTNDGIDRRGFLSCMAWAGAGLVWTFSGGVGTSRLFGESAQTGNSADFTFIQISDSHIGFDKAANPNVTATFQTAIGRINALPVEPDLILHTGDISHLSKPSEFDTADQVLRGLTSKQVFYVPGEHDVAVDNGQQYLERYGKGTKGAGWHSFDHKGVHFVGLINVVNIKAGGGLGLLGGDQLEWLERDLKARGSSTPIVVFAHIPLWAVYPQWGWGTRDSAQALSYLKRFGSVTVLNGHIHQIMQKTEGNVIFHTAMATAFPMPVPGTAPSPGPIKVPEGDLQRVLGITEVSFVAKPQHLAVVDAPLAGTSPGEADAVLRKAAAALPAAAAQAKPAASNEVSIDNFSFVPKEVTVKAGTTVQWTNKDDIPHTATSDDGTFSSAVLDTNQTFHFLFATAGRFPYRCKLHPVMTGIVEVQ